ncbi:hypothetical protein J5N97_016308 [Dioscorea zingiberensis]|uniref:Asparagine synthetase domain-containing protein n=1 Tax=Dioscorea zingiberensis TaxID=325984 RepID=A0A9D5HFI2_9LILI|nr:hypothetical protein J5N97_016308 [Dioscorea zingiberensis]
MELTMEPCLGFWRHTSSSVEGHEDAQEELHKEAKLFFSTTDDTWASEFHVQVGDNFILDLDGLMEILESHHGGHGKYMGCMQSDVVIAAEGKHEWWKGGDSKSYFHHASGSLLILSKGLARYININIRPLQAYAHDDIAVSSWMKVYDGRMAQGGRIDTNNHVNGFLLNPNNSVFKESDAAIQMDFTDLLQQNLLVKVTARELGSSAKFLNGTKTEKNWGAQLHSSGLGFEGSSNLKATKEVATHLGTVHPVFYFTVQDSIDAIHIETCVISTIRASTPMFLMSWKFKSLGVPMVLLGEGSDQIFGGYLYFLSFKPEFGTIEKWALRIAFETDKKSYLPKHMPFRQKEPFTDGVGYSWIDGLKARAAEQFPDRMMFNPIITLFGQHEEFREIVETEAPKIQGPVAAAETAAAMAAASMVLKSVNSILSNANSGCKGFLCGNLGLENGMEVCCMGESREIMNQESWKELERKLES